MGWILNYCQVCGLQLAPDDFDGICCECDHKDDEMANITSHSELIDALRKNYLPGYLPEAIESIARNDHMNKMAGREIPQEIINETLDNFLRACENKPEVFEIFKAGNVLSSMTEVAVGMNLATEEEKSIVVDFINWVGVGCCVDFGLYTRDI